MELQELHVARVVIAPNILPDCARGKPDDLLALVRIAEELALPWLAGIEMNSRGQAIVDDLGAAAFAPARQVFEGHIKRCRLTIFYRAARKG